MASSAQKPLRLLYAAGPGDVLGTFKFWVESKDDPSQVAVTYSSQFYDVCQTFKAHGYILSQHPQPAKVEQGLFTIEHRPNPWGHRTGLAYHLGKIWYGIGLVITAWRFQAQVVIVSSGTTHWWVLWLLPYLGIQVVPALHCVLWTPYQTPKLSRRWLLRLNRRFFQTGCRATLAVSEVVQSQISELTRAKHSPILKFLPLYRREEFADIPAPPINRRPFCVLFVGRLEVDKGVFDLLTVAQHLQQMGRTDLTFDLCGGGAALSALQAAAQQDGLHERFVCHGICNKFAVHQQLSQAHVVVVPTRTEFVEGLNKVVIESVLASRPVVTSKVCPAIDYVRPAAVEVPPEDIKALSQALLQLCDDPLLYQQKQQACVQLQEQFYDPAHSWGAQLMTLLQDIANPQD